jgi:hypothetical protein
VECLVSANSSWSQLTAAFRREHRLIGHEVIDYIIQVVAETKRKAAMFKLPSGSVQLGLRRVRPAGWPQAGMRQ